ncbi:hypothetical protein VTK26DRAFT_945 [Humicola hyalothermophila]
MSLNGLDDARVKEAHELAVAEPGGWFLLKYASRDEVELLGKGNGGIVEIRNNIAQYDEKSPLYGFLRYRRRNVIIKYLPEDCSRLIQARVTVHFDAVCDRFSPYDTTFSIADSTELKDTKLSAACSLHAASGSTSSSTSSLRRRRLMEIAEEEEEEERERKRQSVVNEQERPRTPAASGPPVKLDADLANSPEASRFTTDTDPPQFTGIRPSSPAKSFDEAGRRISSQTSRSDLYSTSSYPYSKPRVKLGPRPSTDTSGRPRSSGGAASRPVSTVPAGIRSLSKSSRKGRSHSQSQDEEPSEPRIQEEAEDSSLSAAAVDSNNDSSRPLSSKGDETSTGSVLASKTNMPAAAATPNKQNTMTPEKARLLKAMKLREKKLAMSVQPAPDAPREPNTSAVPDGNQEPDTAEKDAIAEERPGQVEGQPASNADSGTEVDAGADHASVDTHTDSHPTSPFAASDVGDSTQASSLSESTDETILAKDSAEDVVDENKPNVSAAPGEVSPSEGRADRVSVELVDGRSDKIVTPTEDTGRKEEQAAAAEDKLENKVVSGSPAQSAKSVPPPALTSPPVSSSPSTVEQDTTDVPPAETATQSAAGPDAEKEGVAGPVEERTSSPQIPIPVSKFSTKESKSPADVASQGIPAAVAQASDVDSQDAAPPVPPKDADDGAGKTAEAASAEPLSSRRKFPDPIRTDLDALGDKRRSAISILENDGLMDELQSATVQQATPITVSKSPMSPADRNPAKAPGSSDGGAAPRFLRTVSNPVRNSFLAPGEASTAPVRSASSGTTYLQRMSQQPAPADMRPKSAKLGSSISQRIKALEKLSGAPGPGDSSPKERPATTFFAVRKANPRETSRPSSVIERASSLSRGASPSPPASMESSPETRRAPGRDRSGSLVNRLSMFEGGMPPRGRPESVQVTARIVRDPNQPFPKAPESTAGGTDYGRLELKQSPLVVDVRNRMPSQSPVRASSSLSMRPSESEMPAPSKQTLLERRLSKGPSLQTQGSDMDVAAGEAQTGGDGPRPRRRSSLSFVKDFIKDRTESLIGAKSPSTDNVSGFAPAAPAVPTSRSPSRPPSVHQTVSLTRRLSASSRRSSIERTSTATSGHSMLAPGRTGDAGADSETDAKSIGSGSASPSQSKGSRTSRFMRRLSNTLATGRKNTAPSISPTVTEENAAEVEAASRGSAAAQASPSIVAFMGDVNVQFPDNLLWKRRSVCLDSQGFLILSAVSGAAKLPLGKDKHGAMVKRYHMSDFKAPYAPDVELQELPNSVVLDLVDGSGLQLACEDRTGQMSILQILQEAHHQYANFGH